MAPQQKTLQKAAKAPGKNENFFRFGFCQKSNKQKTDSDGRAKVFSKFKEKRFQNALELTRELYTMRELRQIDAKGKAPEETLEERWVDAGWGVIVGSMQVQKRFREAGIESTYCPLIANENEIVLNRGKDSPDSNFFVFIKFTSFRTTAFFTDPSSGEGGKALPKKKLMKKIITWTSKGKWLKKAVDEITKLAKRKRKKSFYLCMHGHWGENKGRDDGISPRKDVIREMMKWHYDVDATGYHNWIDQEMLWDVTDREKGVGITHIPSTEYTYRFLHGIGDNGFHINLWFADEETAIDFHRKYTCRTRKEYARDGSRRAEGSNEVHPEKTPRKRKMDSGNCPPLLPASGRVAWA